MIVARGFSMPPPFVVMGVLTALLVLPACRTQQASFTPATEAISTDTLFKELPAVDMVTRSLGAAEGIRFAQATSLTGTASGLLYVADNGENSIRVLRIEVEGVREVMRIGRSGSGAAEFNGIGDVDVLSGQFLVAADRGNGRIQRFDRDGALVELFPLTPGERRPNPVFAPDAARGVTGWSEPVALASAPNGDMFIVDARSSGLYRTDRRRERLEQIGAGVLTAPIDVVVSNSRILVLDAADGIAVFDLLGTHIRTVRVGGIQRLALLSDGRLLGIASRSVNLFDEGLAPVARLIFRIDTLIRDVFQRGNLIYVLTDTGLHVATLPDLPDTSRIRVTDQGVE